MSFRVILLLCNFTSLIYVARKVSKITQNLRVVIFIAKEILRDTCDRKVIQLFIYVEINLA
jgi:hypothetical protein